MEGQPGRHDANAAVGNFEEIVDDQQPSCSYTDMERQQGPDAPEEDDLPGIVVSFEKRSSDNIPILPNENRERDQESQPKQDQESEDGEKVVYRTYRLRFYIVAIFSSLGFMQGGLTLSWNVIAESVEAAFGWTNSTLAFMQSWIYISYILSICYFCWLMGVKGLRISTVLTAFLLVCGTGMRCISVTPPTVTVLAHVGHFFVGLAGPVAFAGGPVVSALWFAPQERTTATALMTIAGFGGSAACFIVGPLFVEEPYLFNSTVPDNGHGNYTNIDTIKSEILHVRYVECALCGLIFLCVMLCFPDKPPTPPSRSAAMEKLDLWAGFKALRQRGNKSFWLTAASYGLSTGIYAVWSGLFSVNLKNVGMSELQAGWIGFASVCLGCCFAVIFGYLADHFSGKMKRMILALLFGCIFCTAGFIVVYYWGNGHTLGGRIPNLPQHSRQTLIWAFCMLQGLCNNAPIPLFFEMAIESAYPVPEVVTSAVMSIFFNIFPPVFLVLFQLNIGTAWMNWAMFGALAICVPLMLASTERYERLAIDTNNPALHHSDDEDEREVDPEEGPSGVNGVRTEGEGESSTLIRRVTPVAQYGSINA